MDMFSRRIVPCLFLVMLGCFQQHAHAGDVFAHFMVGVANRNSIDDWTDDINKAKEAHIDGFALNIGARDPSNPESLTHAFTAANNVGGFSLFLSFDYQALGAWDSSDVVALINQYKDNGAYYKYKGQAPLVSTFEGTDRRGDWPSIKQHTGCFFMPDWSSLPPQEKQEVVNNGVVDGLFSWEAWPEGAFDMTTEPDKSYKSVLAGKPYMMPVSPWFYTNLPKYGKNWVWRGDDLWYDRWQQVFDVNVKPDLVQIISWNDYGESHYIGPLRSANFGLFQDGGAPYNYVDGMPHDGWRAFLPYLIDTYKGVSPPAIPPEQVVVWYRLHPKAACKSTEDAGILQDKIFYSALLRSNADVAVTIGSTRLPSKWRNSAGSGIYHGNIDFGSATGNVTVTVSRDGAVVSQVQGPAITPDCQNGIQNWNAWVGPAPTP